MNSRIKAHATAITIICAVIVVLFELLGPKPLPPAPADTQGGRAIEIYSATWGDQCNPFIDKAIEEQATKPPAKNEKGELIPQPKLARVVQNNVLSALSTACNGQLVCSVSATSAALGVEPLATCFKRLKVSYRCYSIDRLWSLDLGQGDTKPIDCHAPPETPAQ